MLVDDDELLRRSSGRFLRRAGFEVVSAGSGAEALSMLADGILVDVFVVDLDMPEMNGLELLGELATRLPEVPRGLWSASPELERLDREQLEPALFVVQKTRPIGELVQAVARAVYGRTSAAGASSASEGGESGGRKPSRSGWVRRSAVIDEIEDARQG